MKKPRGVVGQFEMAEHSGQSGRPSLQVRPRAEKQSVRNP